MKVYVACVLALSIPAVFGLLAASVDDDIHAMENDCAKESGATVASIEEVRNSRKVPDSGDMDVFALCMMKKFHVMTNDGAVNQDYKVYGIPTDTDSLMRVTERCKTMSGGNAGETARKVMNCFLDGNQLVMALTPTPA